ncbi:hypothetical protein ATCC90586_003808 [Pythium insidiosum]|nr:hypothetical protein ATCC90586_003808 [Pythium insidiosum]
MSEALTVARIPALVREGDAPSLRRLPGETDDYALYLCISLSLSEAVDTIEHAVRATPRPTDPELVDELCASLLVRVEEVDAFRETLRPGPLEAIVKKQIARLCAVVDMLSGSAASSAPPPDAVSVLIEPKKRRQIVPVAGALLIKKAPGGPALSRSSSARRAVPVVNPTARTAKPMYHWEKRRPLRFMPAPHDDASSPSECMGYANSHDSGTPA